mgnify:CR=1 FL=1
MPVDWSKYPKDWRAIVDQIRERSGDRCECRGECGAPECKKAPCLAAHKAPHPVTSSRVILTTAHLDHDTRNNDPENLRHLCQRCHLTLDAAQHAQNARRTRIARREAAGQTRLPE